jgi:hypothetical protein
MLSGKLPDCVKCPPNGYVFVIPENYESMELITHYFPSFIEVMGGFNSSGAAKIIEIEGVTDKVKMLRKIQLYVSVYLNRRSGEQDGQSNSTRLRGNRQSVTSRKQGYLKDK